MSDKFKVQSVAEFLSASDFRADAKSEKAEQAECNARLAQQQRQVNNYQKTRSRLSPCDVLQDEIKMLREMTQNSAQTIAAVEAAFDKLQRGEA